MKRNKKIKQLLDSDDVHFSSKPSPEQILEFLENFRLLQIASKPGDSTLISVRIPKQLLAAFKAQAEFEGKKYQTKLKELIFESLTKPKNHN